MAGKALGDPTAPASCGPDGAVLVARGPIPAVHEHRGRHGFPFVVGAARSGRTQRVEAELQQQGYAARM